MGNNIEQSKCNCNNQSDEHKNMQKSNCSCNKKDLHRVQESSQKDQCSCDKNILNYEQEDTQKCTCQNDKSDESDRSKKDGKKACSCGSGLGFGVVEKVNKNLEQKDDKNSTSQEDKEGFFNSSQSFCTLPNSDKECTCNKHSNEKKEEQKSKCSCNNDNHNTEQDSLQKSQCKCNKNTQNYEQENTQKCACQNDKSDKSSQDKKQSFFARHKALSGVFIAAAILAVALAIVGIVAGWQGIKSVGDFVSNQILGMKWLNNLIGSALTAMFGEGFVLGRWGGALQFFVYDTIKIFVLLSLLIYIISYIQSYFPPERTKRILGKYKGIGANVIGALLGTVTPFCSCSSIPIFMGFTRAGLSSGVTFSFLISSPLVDLGALILLASIFGFPIAITYVVVGLVLAVVGGTIIEKTGVGNQIQDYILQGENKELELVDVTLRQRMDYAKGQLKVTIKKVWKYVIFGVAIGAIIHNIIPTEWVQAVLGEDKWYSVIVASIVGVPMYADIFGTIPVAEALFAKGVGVGTILAFMMSVTAMSLPSLIMLSKAVKPKLLASFVAIVVVGIILIGYLFNIIM